MTNSSYEDDWIGVALSEARFGPYLVECGDDMTAAWRLYIWNIQVSGAFYPLLQFVEITLRNALHRELKSRFGRTDWWSAAPLDAHGQRLVKEALDKVPASRSPQNVDDVVAKLSLGFWVSLVSRSYDRTLWVPALHRAFPRYHGRRDHLHAELNEVLRLRNRVMHHEPIHQRDLEVDRARIYHLIDHMSSDVAAEVRRVDVVPQVLRLR